MSDGSRPTEQGRHWLWFLAPTSDDAPGVGGGSMREQVPECPAPIAPLPYKGAGGSTTESTSPHPSKTDLPPPPHSTPPASDGTTLLDVLDTLAAWGVAFALDKGAGTPVLVFDPPINDDALAILEPWRVLLTYVALGRYTGHAPAQCDRCGFISMLSIVNSSGTSRFAPSATWPTCLMNCGGRRVIREADRFGIARVKPSAIRAKIPPSPHSRKIPKKNSDDIA